MPTEVPLPAFSSTLKPWSLTTGSNSLTSSESANAAIDQLRDDIEAIRAQIAGEVTATYTGDAAWRLTVPVERLPEGFMGHVMSVWVDTERQGMRDGTEFGLDQIISENWLQARAVIGLFPANRDGQDDISVYADETRGEIRATLHHLRQQRQKPAGQANRCLADFVAPGASGLDDYIGAFAVTAGIGIDERVAQFEKAHDDYNAILLKALADRLAEALAEYLHERVRGLCLVATIARTRFWQTWRNAMFQRGKSWSDPMKKVSFWLPLTSYGRNTCVNWMTCVNPYGMHNMSRRIPF